MSSIRLKTSNISNFSNNSSAVLVGKNGFNTKIGVIPLLVTRVSKVNSDTNIQFTVRGLSTVLDENNGSIHILNNNQSPGAKQIVYKVLANDPEGTLEGIGYVDPYIPISSNIYSFDLANNTINIDNTITGGMDVYSKLESTPFYVELHQTLLTNNFANRSIFISGSTLQKVKTANVFGYSGVYTLDLGIKLEDKRFIYPYLDGALQSSDSYSWDSNGNVSFTLSNNYSSLKVKYAKYTVPTIELGDNVSLLFNNTISVINSSYHTNTYFYSSSLTDNNIFKIYSSSNLQVNATAFIGINISPNPVGTIGNVDPANASFTLDYNERTYPGNFQLANNFVYRLIKGTKYTPVTLVNSKTLYDVPPGPVSVRARNINPAGRKSLYATATVEVEDLLLPAVQNLSVSEDLYLDTTQGVATRATVSFDHDPDVNILGYELSYKIEGESTGATEFNTIQVPTNAIGSDGRVRYIINNIDRGRTSGVNYLIVRVTPINNDLTGITKQIIHSIVGKTEPPQNVTSFNSAQNANLLTLFWTFAQKSDGTIYDLDLQSVEIRRVSNILRTSDEFLSAWNSAKLIGTIAIPSTNQSYVIDSYGDFTYLIKTIDTSKNESLTVKGLAVTLQRPTNLSAYKTWSEDNPSANDSVAYLANENYSEYNWPGYYTSDNGGFNYAVDDPITPGFGPSTLTENANSTSSGYSVGSNVTDLLISSNSYYQTAVRDIGSTITGRVTLDVNVYSILASTWYSMRENLVFGVSDNNPSSNVLWDDGSYIGSLLLSNGAIYSTENKTLVSSDTYGNVYAIWNSGQFGSDVSNANSFALIAGVINANAIALGHTYNASGIISSSNSLPNLTTSSGSYQLVNLKQWADPEGLGNWQGPDGLISYNTEIRYSTDNVYFTSSNANVNVTAFSSSNSGVFDTYSGGELTFRWFQLRVNTINLNPSLASSVFDKLRYTIDVTSKTYSVAVTVNTNPTIVNFATQNFKATPIITLTPVITSALRINNTFPSYSPINSNSTQANITVYSNTGVFVPDCIVNLQAVGY